MRPTTRFLAWLAKIAGEDTPELEPRTPVEYYLEKIAEAVAEGGGGGDFPIDEYLAGTYPAGDIILPDDYAWDTLRKCYALRYANISSITYGGTNTTQYAGSLNSPFDGCTATSVSCPNLENAGWQMFVGMSSCRSFYLPKVKTIARAAFDKCSAIEVLELPKLQRLDTYALSNCTSLHTLVLANSAVAELVNISALNNTPFASNGTGGTLYVPENLISAYQSANNWATILGYANNSIEAIEGSIYDTQ